MYRRFSILILCISVVALSELCPAPARSETSRTGITPVHTFTHTTEKFTLDRFYGSMRGPMVEKFVSFEPGTDELLWLTGFRIGMEAEKKGAQPLSNTEALQYNCHSMVYHEELESFQKEYNSSSSSARLFTLSQGQESMSFPPGFGLPVKGKELLKLSNQALNLNPEIAPDRVSHRIEVRYSRNSELREPMIPLFEAEAYGMVLVSGTTPYFNVPAPDKKIHGSGCHQGMHAAVDDMGMYRDQNGQTFSTFWKLKPGREENHALVTQFLRLPYDTTLHYASVHLHPFAESLELRDLTADSRVFRVEAENFSNSIGLKRVGSFSSTEGVPMFRGHEYEIVSVYNNTTKEEHDVMASAFLYLRDKTFRLPPAPAPGNPGSPP